MNRPTNEGRMPDFGEKNARLREDTLANIRKLRNTLTKELISIALFLLLSIVALDNFSVFPSLSEPIRAALGRPPAANMISAVLLLYVFSAIILILARMMSGSGRYGGVAHVGYLAGFYIFYHLSGKLPENFWAVFASGATVLGLESYHVWLYCSEEIEKERETLAFLNNKPGGRE